MRDKSSGRLCAVEKVRYGEYAMCAIGSWVPEELVIGKKPVLLKQETQAIDMSSPPKPEILQHAKERVAMDRWWEVAAIKDVPAIVLPETVSVQADHSMDTCVVADEPTSLAPAIESAKSIVLPARQTPDDSTSTSDLPAAPLPLITTEQLHENFLLQYLEALYLQRTSLAFFAKGPLTKARVAFMNGMASNQKLSVVESTTFLRSLILDRKIFDRKYKDKLPAIAKDAAFGVSDDDCRKEPVKPGKSKKIKLKPSKEGLYSCEEKYIRKWWHSDEEELFSSAENRESLVKRRVQLLKTRETLLQIVLVLEILSLEASAEWRDEKNTADQSQSEETQIPSQVAEDTMTVGKQSARTNRKSRQRDLGAHLSLLVSMVLIWQDTGPEADIMSLEVSVGQSSKKAWGIDMLGEFCMDVVVPFFKSRIPDQVAMVVKQFGGPSNSPEKHRKVFAKDRSKDLKRSTSNLASKTDKASQRRALHRFPTEVEPPAGPKRIPGLVRASTDTSLLVKAGIKREGSEGPVNLSALPFLREQKKPRKDSAEKLRLMQKRTVNLCDIGPAKKRKAPDQEEIRAAIESVKRPNRGEAGRVIIEERERRVATSAGAGRKTLNARMNVQVAATPKNPRKIDVYRRESQLSQPAIVEEVEVEAIPSTGATSRIIDTVKRVSMRESVTETPSLHRLKRLDLSAGGHSRSGSGSLNFEKDESSISQARSLAIGPTESIFATPRRPTQSRSLPYTEPVTPKSIHMKSTDRSFDDNIDAQAIKVTPQQTKAATPLKDKSEASGNIYAALGWDDFPIDD